MRKKIVAGNWKMNLNRGESEALVREISDSLNWETLSCDRVIVAPAFVNLHAVMDSSDRDRRLEVCAQNMHYENSGAFTGEVSPAMLAGIGINTVILGHSERRALFGETDENLLLKLRAAIGHGMQTIFCVGEVLTDRKEGKHFDLVRSQLENTVLQLDGESWSEITIAYEPVWAIGTGETATPEQAQEMHEFIRKVIKESFNDSLANKVSILYGGSVKPGNAADLFAQPDVDGALVGGASLDADSFVRIVNAW